MFDFMLIKIDFKIIDYVKLIESDLKVKWFVLWYM